MTYQDFQEKEEKMFEEFIDSLPTKYVGQTPRRAFETYWRERDSRLIDFILEQLPKEMDFDPRNEKEAIMMITQNKILTEIKSKLEEMKK